MYNEKINWIRVAAEAFGILAPAFCMIAYIAAMGGYWISGVGIFLMPITVGVYMLFTRLSQIASAAKRRLDLYWIMYIAKFVFMIGLFLLGPVISDIMARLVNG